MGDKNPVNPDTPPSRRPDSNRGENLAEFIAVGTAVKHHGGELHRAPSGRPFTSDLSGQEFWTLLQTGHRPVGMVMGSCVYHVAHQGMRQSLHNVGQNVELANYT